MELAQDCAQLQALVSAVLKVQVLLPQYITKLWSLICASSEVSYRLHQTPWLRWLVTGLSLQRPAFTPRLVHKGFVVDKVALGQVFFCVPQFFTFAAHTHVSSWWWTIASWWLQFRETVSLHWHEQHTGPTLTQIKCTCKLSVKNSQFLLCCCVYLTHSVQCMQIRSLLSLAFVSTVGYIISIAFEM
jgi:hypothetical protein